LASSERNLSNLTVSESFYRLMQTDPVDDKTLIDGTGSLVTTLAVSGTVDAYYFKGDGSQLTNVPTASLPSGLVSSSAQLGLGPTDSPTFANLTVAGTLQAQQFHTEYISSSVIFESGSTKFGNSLDDIHSFTGSLEVYGGISGSLFGTASYSNLAATASFIDPLFISASVAEQGLAGASEWNDVLNKPAGLVSSSAQTLQHLEGTNIVSSSDQRSILGLGENDSPRFFTIYGTNANFDNNVVIGGTLTARTYVISSSVVNYQTIQVSGSSKFGDSSDDVHQFTGSLDVLGSIYSPSITGSLQGSASYALTASYALNAGGASINTGSFATTASNTFTGDQNFADNTVIGDTVYSTLGGNPINLYYGITKQDIANRFGGIKISNYDWSGGNLSSKFEIYTDSEANEFSTRRLLIDGFGNTQINSNVFITGSQTITQDLTVQGKITAQEFYTEYISSSVLYESGSTKFGDTLDDTHQITGSLLITGSLVVPTSDLPASATVGALAISGNDLWIYL